MRWLRWLRLQFARWHDSQWQTVTTQLATTVSAEAAMRQLPGETVLAVRSWRTCRVHAISLSVAACGGVVESLCIDREELLPIFHVADVFVGRPFQLGSVLLQAGREVELVFVGDTHGQELTMVVTTRYPERRTFWQRVRYCRQARRLEEIW